MIYYSANATVVTTSFEEACRMLDLDDPFRTPTGAQMRNQLAFDHYFKKVAVSVSNMNLSLTVTLIPFKKV